MTSSVVKQAGFSGRIAIAGAGISGLTLAGVLSKELGDRVKIDVFERGERHRDQGYGLDLDEHGQTALARAGLYHRYWEISRPRSDTWAVYGVADCSKPIVRKFSPRILQRLWPSGFGARPETNRGGLREVLLEALAQGTTTVHWDQGAFGIREIKDNGEVNSSDGGEPSRAGRVELLGNADEVLGNYDLVVDAMGLHSTLRQHRVHDSQGKHYSGDMLIHGAFFSPEDTFPPELLQLLHTNGTLSVLGRGYQMFLQRYGAGKDDNRTCFFYMFKSADEQRVFEAMGLDPPSSRESGIMQDDERKSKVQAWLRRDMAEFNPVWHAAVDRLDRVTVRGLYTHGQTQLKEHVSLPLVCIGDSLRNCGLGGGGNLAMQDALELADVLVQPGVFGEHGMDLSAVRAAEPIMLERKQEYHTQKQQFSQSALAKRDPSLGADVQQRELVELMTDNRLLRAAIPAVLRVWHSLYAWEEARGGVGSTPDSPIYSQVKPWL